MGLEDNLKNRKNSREHLFLRNAATTGMAVGLSSMLYGTAVHNELLTGIGMGISAGAVGSYFSVYGKQIINDLIKFLSEGK